MTSEQVTIVQRSWEKIAPIGEATVALFYSRLFRLDPSLRFLFPPSLQDQKARLLAMLERIVNQLDDRASLVPAMEALGKRHATYGVRPEHYETFGHALLWAVGQAVGGGWDAKTGDAWAAVYGTMSAAMISGAAASTPAARASASQSQA